MIVTGRKRTLHGPNVSISKINPKRVDEHLAPMRLAGLKFGRLPSPASFI